MLYDVMMSSGGKGSVRSRLLQVGMWGVGVATTGSVGWQVTEIPALKICEFVVYFVFEDRLIRSHEFFFLFCFGYCCSHYC